jgi:hypothetical protein
MGEVGRPHQVGIGSGEHDKLRLARVARDVGAVREYFHSSIGIAAQRRRAQLGEGAWVLGVANGTAASPDEALTGRFWNGAYRIILRRALASELLRIQPLPN